jgi:ribonuclease VapC
VNGNRIVLDASVLLAIIYREPGFDKLAPELLARATVSTVNLAEAQGKLVLLGWRPEQAWADVVSLASEIFPFSADHAKAAGSMIAQTRTLGLSLGDRACLALALDLKAPVYTADRAWKNLKVGVRIHVIR